MNRIINPKTLHAFGRATTRRLPKAGSATYNKRLIEEFDWFNSHQACDYCLGVLDELAKRIRSAGIVMSPGYSFLTSSQTMSLFGIIQLSPVKWDLPFSRFTKSFRPGNDIFLEAGTGAINVAEEVMKEIDEYVVKLKPGVYQVTFLEGESTEPLIIHVIEYPELDRFRRTIKHGWRELDADLLSYFRRAETDGTIWFEADKIREWLFEFAPESMSDLVLLRAIFHPEMMRLYPEILHRRQNPDSIPSTGDAQADHILRDTYGILVYQEQALMLESIGYPVKIPFKELRLKGHEIARTMLSVEAVAMLKGSKRNK